MKEILQKKIRPFRDPLKKYNALREGLQHLILKILDDNGYFKFLSFVGGTALRVLFDLGRFSEDIDFSLQKPKDPRFDFSKMIQKLVDSLETYGFSLDIRKKQVGAVHNVFLRFKEILQELHVRERKGQKLAVKLEVDTNPPLEARLESSLIQKDFMFTVIHHDLPTLFAGKTLAFLNRQYTKGRDVYDLIWYGTRKTPINKKFFENGLFQATGEKVSWSRKDLLKALTEKIDSLNLSSVAADLLPFLDDPSEIRFLEKPLLLKLIREIEFQ